MPSLDDAEQRLDTGTRSRRTVADGGTREQSWRCCFRLRLSHKSAAEARPKSPTHTQAF